MSVYNVTAPDYTIVMKKLVEESNSKLKSFYCREDLEDALRRFQRAQKDSRIFRKQDLTRLCAARDMSADALLEDPSLLYTVPTRSDLQERLLEILHDNYDRFYSSTDYMTRIVRRMAPEYHDDTVRTAILKKFILGAGFSWKDGKKVGRQYRTGAILQWALEHFSPEESAGLENLPDEEKLRMITEKLDDTIFSGEHMDSDLEDAELFFLLTKRLSGWAGVLEITGDEQTAKAGGKGSLFADLPLREETAGALYAFCIAQEIPFDESGSNIACLVGIADAFAAGRLEKEQANRLIQPFYSLLKEDFNQFLRVFYYKNKKGKYQKLSVLFRTNRRDERDRKAADWEILRLCDDYANGKFRTNGGKTRVYLYYFAMMFGMTVRLKRSDPEDERTDLVKNLFEDYYSDNVIRFLSEEYADGQMAAQYESEPAGDGINYKNYAEVIYLYYLSHRELYASPGEGIDRAERLIYDCRKAALAEEKREPGIHTRKKVQGFTDQFRDEHFRRFLNLGEDSLLDFVLENYQILSLDSEGRAMTMISAEENTAYDNMELIMENLQEAYLSSVMSSQLLALEKFEDAEKQKAARREAREAENVFFVWELPPLLHEKYPGDTNFLRVIDNLDRRLSHPAKNISPQDKRITRSTFLSMCLSDYIAALGDLEDLDSFPELYRDFLDTVNPQLEEARFQPFQEKNLMDLYVLLSLYFYVVKNGR